MIQFYVGPMVRAISSTNAVIWAEFSQPCFVTVQSTSENTQDTAESQCRASMHTVTVGGRHYAAPQLLGLQPSTWYHYQLSTSMTPNGPFTIAEDREEHTNTFPQRLCFRTLDAAPPVEHPSPEKSVPLRLAYGSCRKSGDPASDVLSAFGDWLLEHYEQREVLWPRLLLLIGDQIYADQPPQMLKQTRPTLQNGAATFADFAALYEYVWTQDARVRQVFAMLPTFMIFDDHEITNDWDISPDWRPKMLQQGKEQLLVDGLVAYWVYQGWGNIDRSTSKQPASLLHIMQQAEQSGEDALETLRTYIRQEIYGNIDPHWHYTIATTPPLFVVNARADRSAVFDNKEELLDAPGRIMSKEQMAELQSWIKVQDDQHSGLSIIVSSIPALLPPIIGLAEYVMGARPWQRSIAPLRWLSLRLARFQRKLAVTTSFDHWPVFSATWYELLHILDKSQQNIVVLSGDIHFSYAMEGRRKSTHSKDHKHQQTHATLYQLVCTPFQNKLNQRDQQIIMRQAAIKRLSYGGLQTRVLPLQHAQSQKHVQNDLLFQNTLALVTFSPQAQNGYTIQQTFLGIMNGRMDVIAQNNIVERGRHRDSLKGYIAG